ncbi:hypothetical protein ACFYOY_13375 [Streptomyces sp. NPDC007875]|uniref:hypothetical protein n=1 Tax=Streptomyces sp. NPDC007875 TaxID=3364783 RepID=UPI003693B106
MNITIHRRFGGVDRIEQRIRQIGEQAGLLVVRHLGGRMPVVEVVLSDRRGVVSLVQEADVALAGGTSRHTRVLERVVTHWRERPLAGTTLTPSGALVVIDSSRHRDLRELDRTLVHELTHCVQLTMPGAREKHVNYVRQQIGVTKHSKADERDYERLMDMREQQAENLESLARQLPKGH